MRAAICGIAYLDTPHHISAASLTSMLKAYKAPPTRDNTQSHQWENREAGVAIGSLATGETSSESGQFWVNAASAGSIDGHFPIQYPVPVIQTPPTAAQQAARIIAAIRNERGTNSAVWDSHFALAFYERANRELWLVRDPAGVKPLYYYQGNGLLIFASEIKALLAHPVVTPTIDPDGLTAYLSMGYIPGPLTMCRNISKLLPGQALNVRNGKLTLRRYWAPPDFTPASGTLESFGAITRKAVLEAVSLQVEGKKRVGLYFSAGIDSTVILAALRELGVPEIHTFTAGFSLPGDRERLRADLDASAGLAKHFGAIHHAQCFGDSSELYKHLPTVLQHFDDPILTPNIFTKSLMARAVKDAGVDICLNGSIAEAGFKTYSEKEIRKKLHIDGKRVMTIEAIIHHKNRFIPLDDQPLLLRQATVNPRDTIHSIFSGHIDHPDRSYLELSKEVLWTMLGAEKSVAVQERAAALHGLDMRFPFLATRLMEFSRTIPQEMHLDGIGGKKAVLVSAFADVLPESLLQREKVGFPSYYWNNAMAPFIQQLLSPAALERTGLLNDNRVQHLLEADRSSNKKSSGKITWGLLILQAWYETYVNKNTEWVNFQ